MKDSTRRKWSGLRRNERRMKRRSCRKCEEFQVQSAGMGMGEVISDEVIEESDKKRMKVVRCVMA